MSNKEVGQVLYKGTMKITISDPERYVMCPIYCTNCHEYLGAYNTYYHPEGINIACLCTPETK